jgi:hypothetical protein
MDNGGLIPLWELTDLAFSYASLISFCVAVFIADLV